MKSSILGRVIAIAPIKLLSGLLGLFISLISIFGYFSLAIYLPASIIGLTEKDNFSKNIDYQNEEGTGNIKKRSNPNSNLKTYELRFKNENMPDGYLTHPYSFILKPENGTPPFKTLIKSSSLPSGLIFNSQTNAIEGIPTQKGVWKFTILISDAEERCGRFDGLIKIYRILTVGKNGTFNDDDCIQMAINSTEDLDAIHIEAGIYKLTGIVIPESKSFDQGVKIVGGWDSSFAKSESITILDGELENVGNESENEFILASRAMRGQIKFENITFQNGKRNGVSIQRESKEIVVFSHCSFLNNLSKDYFDYAVKGGNKIFEDCIFKYNYHSVDNGGIFKKCLFEENPGNANLKEEKGMFLNAPIDDSCGIVVQGTGTFTDCTFKNNYSGLIRGKGTFSECKFENNIGQVIFGSGIFKNCSFSNNSTKSRCRQRGGVLFIDSSSTFVDCIFNDNISDADGVVTISDDATFLRCSFTANSSLYNGGAVGSEYTGIGYFTDCKFINNKTSGSGGAFSGGQFANYFSNCLFINNSAEKYGGAIFIRETFGKNFVINCTFHQNKAQEGGGAIYASGKILNSIFFENTMGSDDNDITSTNNIEIDYSLINKLKGAANFGSKNIKGDPKFIYAGNDGLQLMSESPCINAGIIYPGSKLIIGKSFGKEFKLEVQIPSKDLVGKPRIIENKIDMGAYEYQK